MKKSILATLIITIVVVFSCNQEKKGNRHTDETGHDHQESSMNHDHQKPEEPSGKKKPLSPRKSVMKTIGNAHIHIDYSAPSVRDRVVWGGLVSFDKVWSTGAHKATSIDVNKDLLINDQPVQAGKYALFTIPGKEEWTVILNKIWDQHLADDYDPAEDVVRLKVIPIEEEQSMEQLTFEIIPKDDNSGNIRFQWDKVSFELSVRNK